MCQLTDGRIEGLTRQRRLVNDHVVVNSGRIIGVSETCYVNGVWCGGPAKFSLLLSILLGIWVKKLKKRNL